MPHGSAIAVGNSVLTRSQATLAADRGHIVNATARQWPIIAPSTMTWGEIWLMIDDRDRDSRVALLASGYINNNNSVTWTGRIPLEPSMYVQLHIYNSNTSEIKLHISTEVEP